MLRNTPKFKLKLGNGLNPDLFEVFNGFQKKRIILRKFWKHYWGSQWLMEIRMKFKHSG